MTKSKKMKKSTFAIVIMAILMVAMLAFGGTYAYFTATANGGSGEITVGKVMLTTDNTLTITSKENIVPGDEIFGAGSVGFQNASTVDTIVVAKFAFTYTGKMYDADAETGEATTKAGKLVDVTRDITAADLGAAATLSFADAANWTKVSNQDVYIYTAGSDYKLTAGEQKIAFFNATEAVKLNVNRHYENGVYAPTGDADELAWEGATITVTISFAQVQYKNIAGLTYSAEGKINEAADAIYSAIDDLTFNVIA